MSEVKFESKSSKEMPHAPKNVGHIRQNLLLALLAQLDKVHT